MILSKEILSAQAQLSRQVRKLKLVSAWESEAEELT